MEYLSSEWLVPYITAFGYATPRLFAIFTMLPMFTRQALPGLLRVAVAASLGLFLMPFLLEPADAPSRNGVLIVMLVMKEVLLGMLLGVVLALPIWAMEAMGDVIDNQRGASVAQTLSPLTGHDTSPLGDLFSQAAMVFLLVSGGFMLMLAAIYDSYRLWPVYDWVPQLAPETPMYLLGLMDRLLRLAILMGAPVIIAMFLAEVGLALVSRFAPQLQVFFLAMPIKSGLAMMVLAVYAVILFDFFGLEMTDVGRDMLFELSRILR